jgi:hypothetical protein
MVMVNIQYPALLLCQPSSSGFLDFLIDYACRWRGVSCCHFWKQHSPRGGAQQAVHNLGKHTIHTCPAIAASPAMSFDSAERARELVAPHSLAHRAKVNAVSNMLPGLPRRFEILKRPSSSHVAAENKAAVRPASTALPSTPSPLPELSTHASALTSSAAIAIAPSLALTSSSSSSVDSVLAHKSAADARNSSPDRPPKNPRRPRSQKPNVRWSRGGTSSDEIGSDRRVSHSSSSRTSSYDAALSSRALPPSQRPRPQPTNAPNKAAGDKGRLMAATSGGPSGDSRRGLTSPRPKGRGMQAHFARYTPSALTLASRSEEYFLPQCHHLRTLPV